MVGSTLTFAQNAAHYKENLSRGLQAHRCCTVAAMKARGALFVVLAVGLLGIGLAAARAEVWPIALAGAALGIWMGDLARRDLWR